MLKNENSCLSVEILVNLLLPFVRNVGFLGYQFP